MRYDDCVGNQDMLCAKSGWPVRKHRNGRWIIRRFSQLLSGFCLKQRVMQTRPCWQSATSTMILGKRSIFKDSRLLLRNWSLSMR